MSTMQAKPLEPPYKYQQLSPGQIRLLDLEYADNPDEPLKGRLYHADLSALEHDEENHRQQYEALSYTWGPNDKVGCITIIDSKTCGEPETASVIYLTTSLYGALRRLRCRPTGGSNSTLWIDQICINQNDVAERNSQVPLMSTIYRKAIRVVIWLGEEDDNARLALEKRGGSFGIQFGIQQIQALHPTMSLNELYDMNIDERRNLASNYPIPLLKSGYWNAFSELFDRVYFRRVWIVQEVVLGREVVVHCGRFGLKWEDLALTSMVHGQHRMKSNHAHDNVAIIDEMRRDLALRNKPRALLDAAFDSYCYQCTDPKDKIYGVLGLVDEKSISGLPIDYGLSVEEVYIAVARHLILQSDSLEVLSCVVNAHDTTSLPSWVPDWRSKTLIRQRIRPSRSLFEAKRSESNCVHRSYHFSQDSKILHVSGAVVCQVYELGPVFPDTEIFEDEPWSQWKSMAERSSHVNMDSNNESMVRFRRVLICNDDRLDHASQEHQETLRFNAFHHNAFRHYHPEDRSNSLQLPEVGLMTRLTFSFEFESRAACMGRRMMLTVEGYLVMGPSHTRKGDKIVWLEGSLVPVVLRENEDVRSEDSPRGTWTMIGACYLQGFMDGLPSNLKYATRQFSLV